MIVLASGERISPEEIEAHYRRSSFVKEICVMALDTATRIGSAQLFAVVVPAIDRLHAKRIVNAGDLIRFEMEGLTAELPAHKRVLAYDIWFEPLPRAAGGIDRRQVEQRARARLEVVSGARDAPLSPADRDWMTGPHSRVLAIISARLREGARLFPDANLEIDLGVDSME